MSRLVLSWALHESLQRRAVEEVDALGKDYVPVFEDLEGKTPYLDAVIKESLRLYPPGHMIHRDTTEELQLKSESSRRNENRHL